MVNIEQLAMLRAMMREGPPTPYLVLRIRRTEIIHDALSQLVGKSRLDLKKQLKIVFVGEEGVDEGGVKKEFFQILIRELLDLQYGMLPNNSLLGIRFLDLDS